MQQSPQPSQQSFTAFVREKEGLEREARAGLAVDRARDFVEEKIDQTKEVLGDSYTKARDQFERALQQFFVGNVDRQRDHSGRRDP